MAVQTLTLAGKRFVILPESEYRKLRDANRANGRSTSKSSATRQRRSRVSRQDAGDIAEARRRANEATRPYSELRKQLGLA